MNFNELWASSHVGLCMSRKAQLFAAQTPRGLVALRAQINEFERERL
jgi:hypothetical protein